MTRFRDMKIGKKYGIIFGMLIFLIVAANGIVNYLLIDRVIDRMITSELNNVSNNFLELCKTSVDSSIKNYLRSISEKGADLARYYYTLVQQGILSRRKAMRRLKSLIKNPAFGKIGKTGYLAGVSSSGVLAIHPKSEGVNASKHKFMQRATTQKNGFLSYKWKNRGEKVWREKVGWITYFKPWDLIMWASSYKNEFYHLIDMKTLRKSILSVKFGKHGYAFIFDSKGNVVIHRDFRNVNHYHLKDDRGKRFVKQICDTKNGQLDYLWTDKKTGEQSTKTVLYKYYKEMDWIICVGGSKDELYSAKSVQRNITILLIISSLLLVIPVAVLLGSRITKPIKKLNDTVKQITGGDLTAAITVASEDELGQLSDQLNRFISQLRSQVVSIKEQSYSIQNSIQDLNVSNKEISSTSNQQAAAVKEVVTTMEDSDALAKGISVKINEVSRIATNTRDTVEKGTGMIRQNLDMMGEIKQKNADTIAGIRALNDKINDIWEVVNIINGIADQTKIIAFNAELEASAAGEAGRNFEIVANEIRRLADNTVSSTAEIKQTIEEIQHSSDRLIVSSEQETDRIRQGWEISTATGELFTEIQQSAEVSAQSAGEIARSIEQQTSAFNQIVITMKQISEGIDNFVITTKSTTQSSESLQGISEKLTNLVEIYRVEETQLDHFMEPDRSNTAEDGEQYERNQ